MRELHIENTQLTDAICAKLLLNLEKNCSVRLLNLSKNLLSDSCCESFKGYLSKNDTIEELYLHWNSIKSEGAAKIAQGILENYFLKVLDLSWNAIGGGSRENLMKITQTISNPKKKLVHMDFSYNKFTKEETEVFQKALSRNHSLFGFHFDGHNAIVNKQGLLEINSDNSFYDDFNNRSVCTSVRSYERIKGYLKFL